MAPHPITADLHRRILDAAFRNGHSVKSFRRVCHFWKLENDWGYCSKHLSWVVAQAFGKVAPAMGWLRAPAREEA